MSNITETEDALDRAAEEPAVEGEAAPEETTEAPEKGAREGMGRRILPRLSSRIVTAVLLVALIATTAASVFLWRAHSDASAELDAQRQVRTHSAEFARAFLLYNRSDLDGWEQRLTAMAAPDYRNAISQAVKMQFPVIESMEADSQVTVCEAFLNDFNGTVAKTMVVADTQVNSKEFVRTVTGMRLLVELNRVKDRWLVSGVGVLGVDDESMTDHKGNAVDPSKVEAPDTTPTGAPQPDQGE